MGEGNTPTGQGQQDKCTRAHLASLSSLGSGMVNGEPTLHPRGALPPCSPFLERKCETWSCQWRNTQVLGHQAD